jgi:hypothetical protein
MFALIFELCSCNNINKQLCSESVSKSSVSGPLKFCNQCDKTLLAAELGAKVTENSDKKKSLESVWRNENKGQV